MSRTEGGKSECGEFQPRYCHVVFRFRLRRRKNRYEPPLVVPTQDQELSPNVLYERDSSYNAPSSSYEAPGYSNSYKEYKMIFTPSLGPEAPYLGVLIFLINEENHSISLLSLRHTSHPATAQVTKPTEGETSYIPSHLSSLISPFSSAPSRTSGPSPPLFAPTCSLFVPSEPPSVQVAS